MKLGMKHYSMLAQRQVSIMEDTGYVHPLKKRAKLKAKSSSRRHFLGAQHAEAAQPLCEAGTALPAGPATGTRRPQDPERSTHSPSSDHKLGVWNSLATGGLNVSAAQPLLCPPATFPPGLCFPWCSARGVKKNKTLGWGKATVCFKVLVAAVLYFSL